MIDLVHAASEKLAELAGFDADGCLDFGLAVRETAINAMRHGNGLDPAVKVHVALDLMEGGVRARIRDHGAGFDPDAEPDPTDGDNLLRTSGRGLLLVRSFVDEVKFRYRDGYGMTVTLTKMR